MRGLALSTALIFALMIGAPAAACEPGRFHFGSGSARLDPRQQWVIDDIVGEFRGARPGGRVRLLAGTDGVGSMAANLRLARRRGEAAKAALVRSGIPARAIDIVVQRPDPRTGAHWDARAVGYEIVGASAGCQG
jgi:hypothetical protein